MRLIQVETGLFQGQALHRNAVVVTGPSVFTKGRLYDSGTTGTTLGQQRCSKKNRFGPAVGKPHLHGREPFMPCDGTTGSAVVRVRVDLKFGEACDQPLCQPFRRAQRVEVGAEIKHFTLCGKAKVR